MPQHHRALVRALKATIAAALIAGIALVAIPSDSSHPPERVTATAVAIPAPVDWSGLRPYADRQLQVTAFYAWASNQPTPPEAPPPAASKSLARDTHTWAGSGGALEAIAVHFPDIYGQAVGVAHCESTLNPGAVSPDGRNWGLFQINIVHRSSFEQITGRSWSDVLNADANAQFARWLHDQSGGWGPWSCAWAAS